MNQLGSDMLLRRGLSLLMFVRFRLVRLFLRRKLLSLYIDCRWSATIRYRIFYCCCSYGHTCHKSTGIYGGYSGIITTPYSVRCRICQLSMFRLQLRLDRPGDRIYCRWACCTVTVMTFDCADSHPFAFVNVAE